MRREPERPTTIGSSGLSPPGQADHYRDKEFIQARRGCRHAAFRHHSGKRAAAYRLSRNV